MVCKTPWASVVTGIETNEARTSDVPALEINEMAALVVLISRAAGTAASAWARISSRGERRGGQSHSAANQAPSQEVASTR